MLILVKNQDLKPSLRIERPVLTRARQRAGRPGPEIFGFFPPLVQSLVLINKRFLALATLAFIFQIFKSF